MAKIYVPTQYLNKPCYQVNQNYIRVYATTHNSNNTVYDIYVNQDYQVRRSTSGYSSSTYCDNINTYTDEIYYRVDFPQIILMFFLLVVICFYTPWKILLRMFRRWQ